MATIDWPYAQYPQACTVTLRAAGVLFRSPFNGSAQTADFIGERWLLSVTLPERVRREAGAVEALAFRLGLGRDRVRCWHFARPVPAGTMRGTPVLSAGAARGDATLAITGGTASGTLLPGDMLGCGGQLFMVKDPVTLNGSGAGTVALVNRVRATIAGGAAVAWDRPTAEFIAPTPDPSVAHRPGAIAGAAFDLEEVW